ncbi:MAG: HAMP domain-containing histidine kinase [Vicinamibacterales bacterium]|nr:HAMP domain-containing histidine kinase [Vicinamibacterales bacterium]
MKVESLVAWGGWLTVLLAVAVCLGIATLLGFGYRATREWQHSSDLLVERDTAESADRIVTALNRDMQGAQARVLANRDWGELSIDSLTDTTDQVATAFARYPYPESFFSWGDGQHPDVVFFNRANRYPAWMRHDDQPHRSPVVVVRNPAGTDTLRRRIDAYGALRYRYVAFNADLAGQPYQVVARLTYADSLDERLLSVAGFTVNLAWVRGSYFADILSQVVNRNSRLDVAVLDDRRQPVVGTPNHRQAMVREFPLLFLDPSTSRVALAPDTVRIWQIAASQAPDSALLEAAQGADETLLVAGAAALTLGIGLFLAIRAVRAGVALTAMRSEFVSSVTHELKMPLANIRAMADTLARRPLAATKIHTYAEYLTQEAKRLTRLVDNLLAYSRITDVTNVYSFEPIAPAELVDDVLQSFRLSISERDFTIDVDIPVDLPFVRADRAAMLLALDNVVDNAIRYSPDRSRSIRVTGRQEGSMVIVEVRDRGVGIPAAELAAVQRKFVRGRDTRSAGSGLGLAIVRRIVADHHGTFALESKVGAGTTARIGLPASAD